ncbi:MAG: beta-ketoacyl-[acyl-carrier-protein] synthase family protein [Deltaproteobacteria bacterium]|nr:beta-ketoacyl-[acyl-carrier-protein] synthase family protein [Deltaproteobacteria bacterium]
MSPVAVGVDAFDAALAAGEDGAAEITRFDHEVFDRHIACEVKDFVPRDHLTAAEVRRTGRCAQMALSGMRQALSHARIGPGEIAGPRTSVVIGTTMGEANVLGELEAAWIHEGDHVIHPARLPRYGTTLLPIHLARAIGARGLVQTLPSACAAGNYAIGFAAELIRAGRADVVITGASEVLEKLQFAGFARLGAMSPDFVRPFDVARRGLLVGEGAGIFVLESEAHALARDANLLAEVGGLACDAHHITRPHPEGVGSLQAMRRAIETSRLRPEQVDLVNAHGTATQANDAVEAMVLGQLFQAKRPAVTSIKSMLGHCMGAASAIEAVSCVLSILNDSAPPTTHHENPDPGCDVDLVVGGPRAMRCDVVLNNALAFGGYDAAVVFAKPGILEDVSGPVCASAVEA